MKSDLLGASLPVFAVLCIAESALNKKKTGLLRDGHVRKPCWAFRFCLEVQVLRTQRTTDHQWKPVLRVKTHSCPACTKTLAFYRQHGFAMKQAFPHYESTCAESPTSTNTNASNRNVGRSTLRFRVCRKSHAYQYKRSKS